MRMSNPFESTILVPDNSNIADISSPRLQERLISTNELIIKDTKQVGKALYMWAVLFFGLSSILPNAAVLTDMDYFIDRVSIIANKCVYS